MKKEVVQDRLFQFKSGGQDYYMIPNGVGLK